jgi:hypothetical protein
MTENLPERLPFNEQALNIICTMLDRLMEIPEVRSIAVTVDWSPYSVELPSSVVRLRKGKEIMCLSNLMRRLPETVGELGGMYIETLLDIEKRMDEKEKKLNEKEKAHGPSDGSTGGS